MLKRVLSYLSILSALVLSSCSDEIDFQPAEVFSSDGMVEFNIAVPDMSVARSRAVTVDPEYQVNDITLLLYSTGDGYDSKAPAQYEKIYLDNSLNTGKNKLEQVTETTLRLSFNLKKELRSGGFRLYAFANLPSGTDLSSTTVQGLGVTTLTAALLGGEGNLVMMAKTSSKAIKGNLNTTITLSRVDAKVTVTDAEPDSENTEISVKYYPALLCGAAQRGYIVAPAETGDDYYAPSVAPDSYPESLGDTDAKATYFPQTKNAANSNGIGGNLYVIVKASYGIDEYYYRLDFWGPIEEGEGENKTVRYEYLNAEANHWYQFVIEEVTGPGYATPALAALHPVNTVKYTIHDHSPESLNMTSDGFRELGVSHDIDYTGSSNGADEWNEQVALYVKLFSKDETEYPATANAVGDLITVENSWLVTGTPEEVSDDAVTGGTATGSDSNDPGKVYRIPLRFVNTTLPGTLENTITIEWLGLKRVVNVTWERQFNGAEVTSASLSMANPGSTSVNIADYWSFLSSTDDPEAVTGTGNLWGVQEEANNGKIRNEGFHFPVMYGSRNTTKARYTYTLTFDQGKFADSSLDYTASYTVTGDIKDYVTVTKTQDKPARFTVTYNTDNYNYLTGKLNVIITYNTTPVTREVYSYDLYHTGFFHRDSQAYRLGEHDSGNYYYYEVVPVTVEGRTRYILDRNLAAKSAQDFILDSDGATVTGNPDARGGYYIVAKQLYNDDDSPAYKDPEMLAGVCPPGYSVPEKGEWDAIRLSSSFHTDYDGRYYPAYYDTPVGRVYFPKSMMMTRNTVTGESRSGYYWTSTAASGTEKDEIGRWLNMLVLTGSSSSFSNGYVLVKDHESEAYGASVRCINESSQTFSISRTTFNVSGATHVYLYTGEGTNRTATTTWPGHAIGNYITMAPGNWFQFNYESTQFSPEQLKVIFNFVDEEGIIHSFSRKADGTTQYTSKLSPYDLIGWDVVGDTNSNIIPSTGKTINAGTENEISIVPATETALNNWWLCENALVWDYKKNPYPVLYLTGDAVPAGWSLNPGTPVYAHEENIYVWEGNLKTGEFKGYWNPDGGWEQTFLRPVVSGVNLYNIPATGSSDGNLKWEAGGYDDKWKVTSAGKYRLTFNLNTMKFKTERLN